MSSSTLQVATVNKALQLDNDFETVVAAVFDIMTVNIKAGDSKATDYNLDQLISPANTSTPGSVKTAIVRTKFMMRLMRECENQIARGGDSVPLARETVEELRGLGLTLIKFYRTFSIERPEGDAGKERGSFCDRQ